MNSFPACFFLLLLRLDRLSTRNFVPDISHNRKKEFSFFVLVSFLFSSFIQLFFLNLLRFFVALWTALVQKFDYFIAVLLIDGFSSFSLILCLNASGFWTCAKCFFVFVYQVCFGHSFASPMISNRIKINWKLLILNRWVQFTNKVFGLIYLV